jgi:hypothetical protein
MISCPFEYHLSDQEMQKLGELSLTWSHTDHTIGNCLKAVLNFNDEEAIALIFPLGLQQRVQWLRGLKDRMNKAAQGALDEFTALLSALQAVRNLGVHGVIIADTKDGPLFHLRSKDRTLTKADLFSCEEFTNYCARVAYGIRFALFSPIDTDLIVSLPERPEIPKALEPYIQNGKRLDRQP